MSRIYWDTMLFIYWLEDNPQFGERMKVLHSRMCERNDHLITSAFTIGEVMTGFHRKGAAQSEAAKEVRRRLNQVIAEIVPFTMETTELYAGVRAAGNISPADAIHLASAAEAGTDLFLTNDNKLLGRIIPGIQFIASLDTPLL